MTASELRVDLNISSLQLSIPVFMRINGYNGIIKWTTAVCIKDNNSEMTIFSKGVNSDNVAFIRITQFNNIFFIRIDGNGNAFQIVGFQNKNLNSLFQYADVFPVSLTNFMLVFNTDELQYGLSVSDTSGIDLAFFVGNFDLTTNYTLMIDYNSDYPYFNYKTFDSKYFYILYISSNNYPQVIVKVKLNFFNGLNYDQENLESC